MTANWRLWLALSLLAACTTVRAQLAPEVVVNFDLTQSETPGSIAIGPDGSRYVSLALTGEVRKIAPDGTQSTVAILPLRKDIVPCGNAFGIGIMDALALDHRGAIYVSVSSCDVAHIGVWKIEPGGTASHLAQLPAAALPGGIAHRGRHVYVADAKLGLIWRVADDGSTPAEAWLSHPLLAPLPDFFPGPNGLQFFHNELYVSVSDRAHVLAIPMLGRGEAGEPRVHATGVSCDDFAFDVAGSLYCTTNPFNTVVKIEPSGAGSVILNSAHGLDNPAAAAFGRRGESFYLYLANAALPWFSVTHRPSLMRVRLDTAGYPR